MYNNVYVYTYIEDLSVIVCRMPELGYIKDRIKIYLKRWVIWLVHGSKTNKIYGNKQEVDNCGQY